MRGLFVTGTDTGVGKTVVAGAIVAALRSIGTNVRALKPVITGLEEPSCADWPPDHELLARLAGCRPCEVALAGYEPAVSPHLAAELAGRPIEPERLEAAVRATAAGGEAVIVEGVGGLLVPLAYAYDVRALAAALGIPLVIVARPGLGTLNHTLLTLEAARAAGLRVAGVVLTPWPGRPGQIERSNRETIARLGDVDVCELRELPRAEPELLAQAGRELPLERWLGSGSGMSARALARSDRAPSYVPTAPRASFPACPPLTTSKSPTAATSGTRSLSSVPGARTSRRW